MPPPPEPTEADREYAREQAEAWCEEYSTDMGGGFVPNEYWVNGVASRILAGILHGREWAANEVKSYPKCDCMEVVGFCECYGATCFDKLADHIRRGPQ